MVRPAESPLLEPKTGGVALLEREQASFQAGEEPLGFVLLERHPYRDRGPAGGQASYDAVETLYGSPRIRHPST